MSTAASIAVRHQLQDGTARQRVARILFMAEIAVALTVLLGLAIIGAADAAGIELVGPNPGPLPVPSVAPPGLDL